MLARIQKSIREKDAGFTLIELLVVMIIIGILAAIAIPVFLSQRSKAQDSATKADVSMIGKEIATHFIDKTTTPAITTTGTAPNVSYALDTTTIGRQSTGVVGTGANGAITVKIADGNKPASSWCVDLTNPNGTGADAAARTWRYSAAGGLVQGICP